MKIGRNQPCPCGSGKKYKKCCLPKDEEAAVLEADLEPQEEGFPLLAKPETPVPRMEVQTP
ncbi:MAG: SEC-C metal-binding domain-containing protein, partial [Planctomycetota bacterium]